MYIYPGKSFICTDYNNTLNDFKKKLSLIPVISDNLDGNNMRISSNFYNTFNAKDLSTGKNTFQFFNYNDNGGLSDEIKSEEINIISDGMNKSSPMFLEVSEEFYYKYYNIKATKFPFIYQAMPKLIKY